MEKIVIIRNIKTGQEERAAADVAERLKNSKYAHAFEFREIQQPPEAGDEDPKPDESSLQNS